MFGDVNVSEDARMTEVMLTELLSTLASSLASVRRINQEKIEAVDQDLEVAVKSILQELQIIREMYEDAILFLYNMKPPFDSVEEALAKLMVALKKHISLQESLFKSAEVPDKLAPSSLVSIKYEPSENHEDTVKIETDPDMGLEIFSNPHLPHSYDSMKIEETAEGLEDVWSNDEPIETKEIDDTKVKEESGEMPRKKSVPFVDKTRKKYPSDQPAKCEQCDKVLCNRRALKNHMEWHKREKRLFECEKCGKKIKVEAVFKKHQESHLKVKTEERMWSCEYCAKSFNQQGNFIKHMKIHTGEKKHACDQCDHAFFYLSALKRHMKMHTGEKSIECEDCGRMFSNNRDCQRHRNAIHLGIKPYACKLCGKSFSRANYQKKHMLQMHSEVK